MPHILSPSAPDNPPIANSTVRAAQALRLRRGRCSGGKQIFGHVLNPIHTCTLSSEACSSTTMRRLAVSRSRGVFGSLGGWKLASSSSAGCSLRFELMAVEVVRNKMCPNEVHYSTLIIHSPLSFLGTVNMSNMGGRFGQRIYSSTIGLSSQWRQRIQKTSRSAS